MVQMLTPMSVLTSCYWWNGICVRSKDGIDMIPLTVLEVQIWSGFCWALSCRQVRALSRGFLVFPSSERPSTSLDLWPRLPTKSAVWHLLSPLWPSLCVVTYLPLSPSASVVTLPSCHIQTLLLPSCKDPLWLPWGPPGYPATLPISRP